MKSRLKFKRGDKVRVKNIQQYGFLAGKIGTVRRVDEYLFEMNEPPYDVFFDPKLGIRYLPEYALELATEEAQANS